MSILDHVPPGMIPREVQKKMLLEIEENWDEYDTFVLEAPVAAGKSLISMTVANWCNAQDQTAAILTPRALLQDQYQRDYPAVPSLKGKARYQCKKRGYRDCSTFYESHAHYCCGNSCRYKSAVNDAKEADNVILNFHSHLFSGITNDTYKDVLIIDEAHNLIPMLADIYTLQLWEHEHHWPYATHTKDDVIEWLSQEMSRLQQEIEFVRARYTDGDEMPKEVRKGLISDSKNLKRYEMIKEGLLVPKELFHIALVKKPFGRKKESRQCLEVKPISLKSVPHQMWPQKYVKKIVMMSATIYDKDIERLGISHRRVYRIKCNSPIPAANRPIIIDPVASMSFKTMKPSTREISNKILKLAEMHQGKGVIHLTYGLVKEFKKYLKGPRYLWHTDKTREKVFKQFVESSDNKILMACGMAEGIDLVGEEFEWQVIAKTVFPSLADPLQKHFLNRDPLVYTLETVRTTVQQSGRICRTPTDYGVTYILDASFANFYRRATAGQPNYKLFPDYFIEAMEWKKV